MKKGRWLVFGLLGMVLAVGLSGCIISTSPDSSKVIVMNPGETKVFKVSGVNLNTSITKCVWSIPRKDGNPAEVFENTDHVEFTVNPEGEKSNRVIITCEYWRWLYMPPSPLIGSGGWGWVPTGIRTWNICVPRDTAPVWQGNYYITDSTDVQMLNGYTEITGVLDISNSNLKSLEGLETLTNIGRDLQISDNTALTSLSGLENLTSVGGYLEIGSYGEGNHALKSLSGLENLTSVGSTLDICNNAALTSLSGLENLTSVGSTLDICNNYALKSLSGLENITSVGGDLCIQYNYALKSLSGLENLTSVGGSLYIDDNVILTSLSGLEGLTSVGREFCIRTNALTSLSGLENLTSVGCLVIGDNAILRSLSGLENITSVASLSIWGNPALTALGMSGLQRVDRDFVIEDNPLLCTSLAEELMNQVLAGGGIGGTIYISNNKECTTP